jgi:cytochrome c556
MGWVALAGLAGAVAIGPSIAVAVGEDPVAERKANRKEVGDLAKQIKAVVDAGGPAAGVVEPARKIAALEAPFDKMFPPGSDKGDTKALPAVWTDWKGFEDASHTLVTQATALADAGAAGKSPDDIKTAFAAMGKACGGCHNTYRAK